ncbi:hypothetical protein CCR85_07845 [Rhodothalassium salexigens]|uniref:hypothetical protein n=1 Tax=Rhodothalassium salexigens TaxID=1086 RepID=UPI0019131DA0|nr:hypothetical protein [Rhodothalassium salexigens]MBK5911405.1 hypothetical protein [Rhodothalassium salexigens]MBK5920232.1 hypothetical protein [Rhodothalassium salexigens]
MRGPVRTIKGLGLALGLGVAASLWLGVAPAAEAGGVVRVGYGFGTPWWGGGYRYGSWWRPRIGAGYYHGYGWPRYRYRRGGADAAEIAAAAVLGLGAGLALADLAGRDDPPRRVIVPQDRPVRRSAPRPGPVPMPAPRVAQGAERPAWAPDSFPGERCLVVREYQTEIVVAGETRAAYGAACLKPDGSWLRGPAQPVPDTPT